MVFHAREAAGAETFPEQQFGRVRAPALRGVKRCRSVATSDTCFCDHHSALAAQHGAETVKQGERLPKRRNRVQPAVVAEAVVTTTGNGRARRVLLDTATGANKQLWATITCKHCSKPGRYEITVPDNKVRLDAIQALLHESLGRPPSRQRRSLPRLCRDQLTLVFATQFAGGIPTVFNGSGNEHPRHRLAHLSSDDERKLLRQALDELSFATERHAMPTRPDERAHPHGRCY
jgi:hypothetical protein